MCWLSRRVDPQRVVVAAEADALPGLAAVEALRPADAQDENVFLVVRIDADLPVVVSRAAAVEPSATSASAARTTPSGARATFRRRRGAAPARPAARSCPHRPSGRVVRRRRSACRSRRGTAPWLRRRGGRRSRRWHRPYSDPDARPRCRSGRARRPAARRRASSRSCLRQSSCRSRCRVRLRRTSTAAAPCRTWRRRARSGSWDPSRRPRRRCRCLSDLMANDFVQVLPPSVVL